MAALPPYLLRIFHISNGIKDKLLNMVYHGERVFFLVDFLAAGCLSVWLAGDMTIPSACHGLQ
jgi:hypothetical protein